MTNPTVEQVRAEYAKWFVRRHYLRLKLNPNQRWLENWRRAERQGYIRFYKTLSGSTEYHTDEWDDYYRYPNDEKQWYQLQLTDLDLPINDNSSIAKSYRRYREHALDCEMQRYLIAEANFHVVSNEAWLRAYGVDPAQNWSNP